MQRAVVAYENDLTPVRADTLKQIKSAGAGSSAGPRVLDVFADTLALDGSTPTPPSPPPRKKTKKRKVESLIAD